MFQKDNRVIKTYSADLSHHFNENEEEDDSTLMQTSTMSLPNHNHPLMKISMTDNEQYQSRSDYLSSNDPCLYQKSKTMNDHVFGTTDRILSQRPSFVTKLRTINSNEQLSSSDSNGSIRKNIIDRSTMIIDEKNSPINLYASWTKSATVRPVNDHNNNNIDSIHCNKSIPYEKFCTESLLKQKMCSSKKHNHTSVNTIPLKSQLFSTNTLQKPRVYTNDDQNLPIQQQNILSSSSRSPTLSLKNKNIKEAGETKSYSIQDGCHLTGSARGIMDYYGGKLSCPLTGFIYVFFVPRFL